MKKSMRKGFTLVELLIVIVVIGVLSAMMMLSSTEAVSSARAADIISDLRNLKTATLAWYADNLDTVESKKGSMGDYKGTDSKDVLKYLGTEKLAGPYTFVETGSDNAYEWFVKCDITDAKVAEKLDARKSSVGILGSSVSNDKSTKITTTTGVYMFIR